MATLPKTFSQPFSRDEERAAAAVLGAEHPLVHSLALRRTFVRQLAITSVPIVFALAGILRHVDKAVFVLAAAGFVEFVLVAALHSARSATREHARDLLASGHEELPLHAVVAERRRLLEPKTRRRMARSLERCLHDAEHWDYLPPHCRPLAGVRSLRHTAEEARRVVSLMRTDSIRPTSVQAVATVDRVLTDGYSSPLLRGDVDVLRRELVHIADLLSDRATTPHEERLAA